MKRMGKSNFSNLQLACHYWEQARRQNSRQAAAIYYKKAYVILLTEMGADNKNTLELHKEMTEVLSKKLRPPVLGRHWRPKGGITT